MSSSPYRHDMAASVGSSQEEGAVGDMFNTSMCAYGNDSFVNAIQGTSITSALRSPFVRELVRHRKTHRWATPSIIPDLYLPKNIDMEYSISVPAFGSHLSMTGLLGDVAQRAAVARYADACYYSVAGTTTSNHKVMCALSRAFCGVPVLACRNVHHSITHSSSIFGVPLRFLNSGGYCPQYEAVLPPTPAELERQLQEDSEVAAVLITSPTYEGIIADVEGLAAVAHKYGRILWVDQAWGSHLGWGDSVPPSAMQLGADFTTESTHKTGGAMQGASLLLWKKNERTAALEAELYDAHCEHETTSPNFAIIASIDAALYRLSLDQHMVREAVQCCATLKGLMKDAMPCMTIEDVMAHAVEATLTKGEGDKDNDKDKAAAVRYFLDPMRANFSVPNGVSAFELAAWLDKHGIVCEKNGLTSILFIATYQLPSDAPIKACALMMRYLATMKAAAAVGIAPQHTPHVAVAHHDAELLSAIPPEALAAGASAAVAIRGSSVGNTEASTPGGNVAAKGSFASLANAYSLSDAASAAAVANLGTSIEGAQLTRGLAIAAVPSSDAEAHADVSALVAPQWLLNASSMRAVKVGPSSRPSRVVPFAKAVGCVAGETIECYPPGIPVIIPGYRITQEQLDYLTRMKDAGAHIVCTDKTMATIRVRTDVE